MEEEKKKEDNIVKIKNSLVEKRITNIDRIMKVRLVNCLVNGNKQLKNDEIILLDELRNNSFSSDGPIINNILDGNIVCVSPDCVVLSYDLESIMYQNLSDLDNVSSIYNHYTKSNKLLCLISSSVWNDVSSKYIECVKNKNVSDFFKYEEEPDPIYEEVKNNDIMVSSANTIFGNEIVEIN